MLLIEVGTDAHAQFWPPIIGGQIGRGGRGQDKKYMEEQRRTLFKKPKKKETSKEETNT